MHHRSRRGVRRRPVEPRPSARGRRKEKGQGSSLPILSFAANLSRRFPIQRLPDYPGWTVFDLPSTPLVCVGRAASLPLATARRLTSSAQPRAPLLLPSTSISPILRRTCCWMSARGARSSACSASELGRLSPPPTAPCRRGGVCLLSYLYGATTPPGSCPATITPRRGLVPDHQGLNRTPSRVSSHDSAARRVLCTDGTSASGSRW